jgi:hypothetical protein
LCHIFGSPELTVWLHYIHNCFHENWEYIIFNGTAEGDCASASATPHGKMGGEMNFCNDIFGVLGSTIFLSY